jgi:hypothetical protein
MNFVIENITIDPTYIELDNWNVHINFKEAQNLHIDNIIRPFNSIQSWTLQNYYNTRVHSHH